MRLCQDQVVVGDQAIAEEIRDLSSHNRSIASKGPALPELPQRTSR